MYHNRQEDLIESVADFSKEALHIERTIEYLNRKLEQLYKLKDDKALGGIRFVTHNGEAVGALTYSELPAQTRDEIWETKKKLDSGVLHAFIILYEAEREDLIKKWNKLGKYLKEYNSRTKTEK